MAAEGPGIIRQAMPALTRASAAQSHITSRNVETNEDRIEDSIADAVSRSSSAGGFSAASRLWFNCNEFLFVN